MLVNGKEVMVLGEKESLTSLGRDELLDDRVGKMGVLSRWVNLTSLDVHFHFIHFFWSSYILYYDFVLIGPRTSRNHFPRNSRSP